MKKQLLFLLGGFALIAIHPAQSQTYCTPPPFITGPFSGITNVTLHTLNNTTSDADGVTYYSSLEAPKLQRGSTYEMSVTTEHNLVGAGFSGNLFTHAWIDWNQDGDFEDNGETVFVVDDQFKGTYTNDVVIPADALTGVTRMRVYNDMPDYEGHEIPHPCGYAAYPNNPIGHHGEVEDYDIEVTSSATGIESALIEGASMKTFINASGQLELQYRLSDAADVKIVVHNMMGQTILEKNLGNQSPGFITSSLNWPDQAPSSTYIVTLFANDQKDSRTILIH